MSEPIFQIVFMPVVEHSILNDIHKCMLNLGFCEMVLPASEFSEISGCPVVRDNQNDRRATKIVNAVVQRTTINFKLPLPSSTVCSEQTTKNLSGQQETATWLSVGQPHCFSYFRHWVLHVQP